MEELKSNGRTFGTCEAGLRGGSKTKCKQKSFLSPKSLPGRGTTNDSSAIPQQVAFTTLKSGAKICARQESPGSSPRMRLWRALIDWEDLVGSEAGHVRPTNTDVSLPIIYLFRTVKKTVPNRYRMQRGQRSLPCYAGQSHYLLIEINSRRLYKLLAQQVNLGTILLAFVACGDIPFFSDFSFSQNLAKDD